jgi:hypothetical protein
MRNKTKQMVLIPMATFAIAALMLSCSSVSELGERTKAEAGKATAFQLSGLSINPTEVAARDEVVITAEVTNITGVDDTYNAELKINNVTEASDKVLVPAGKTQTLTFVIFKDAPGTYKVALGELAGQFVVSEPVSEPTKSGCCGSAASGTAATSGCCGATGSSNPVVPVPRRVSGCCGR